MKLRYLIVLICAFPVFWGICLKFLNVPITHDEAWSAMYYTKFSVWDIMRFPDSWPNNHIVNTLLTKLCIFIFGSFDWAVRLPNVIAFLIYGFFAVKISNLVYPKSDLLFTSLLVLSFANPYMLDFFSLCRGYGLSLAFLMGTTFFILKAYKKEDSSSVNWAVIFGILCAYSNFSSLVFWAASILAIILFILFYSKLVWRDLAKVFLSALAFLALIASPIIKMSADNQFKYWSSNGFFQDTIMSSVTHWRYGAKLIWDFDSLYLGIAVVFVYAVLGVYFIIYFLAADRKDDFFKGPFSVTFMLLSLTAIVNSLQCALLDTPFLNGRTALLYYPLFALCFGTWLNELYHHNSIWKKTACCLGIFSIIVGSIHLVDRFDKRYVREWWYDQNNKEVLAYLEGKNATSINLACNWIYHPSLKFYTSYPYKTKVQLLPYSKDITKNENADYIYIESKDFDQLKGSWTAEKEFALDRWLVRRKGE